MQPDISKLDRRNAYHLVHLHEGDEWKTPFNTHLGHFEYLVITFGLTNGPAVFQVLSIDVLREMVDRFVFVYLDDILIFCRTPEHVLHVRQVLQKLLANKLFVKSSKCEFHVSSVSFFLGFIVGRGQLKPDPEKVLDWPKPSKWKQPQRFLAFPNFKDSFLQCSSVGPSGSGIAVCGGS